MIQDDQVRFRKEFESYLQFWNRYMFKKDGNAIYPEISTDNIPNERADMGAMYLSRVIYGASRGCLQLKTEQFKPLALVAFKMLAEFKNPLGGYFWARKYNMEWIHDPENVNMAQAFILYGFADYALMDDSSEGGQLMDKQLAFFESTLKDDLGSFYLDGFDEQWARTKNMTRSFATHFHFMEALVKVYELKKDVEIKNSIQNLLEVILDRFIEKEHYSCIHRFTEDWQMLPNENWAGHNAECSWVMCHAAKTINNTELIERTEKIAVLMMNKVIEKARDVDNGGYFNLISADGSEEDKSWWPQAEVVLGLLNAYKITGDKAYQKLAQDQIRYIQKYFINDTGEWNTAVNQKGEPIKSTPQIFFWKSMYHTVRYYDYLITNT